MPTTAAIPPQPSIRLDVAAPRLGSRELAAEAWEREQLIDRLRSLRRVLPVLAQEMASARRQAARLKTDNRRLAEQVRELRATLDARQRRGT